MKTVVEQIIEWAEKNSINIQDQAGVNVTAIDLEEMKRLFGDWLHKEQEQLRDFALSVMPRWIPVTVRLPTKDDASAAGRVIIVWKSRIVDTIHFDKVKNWTNIIYWQPLPPAPGKEESK